MKLSKRIQRINESQTLEMAALSRSLKEQGVDIIDLSVGQPDFKTPEFIREAAKKAIDENFSYYTAVKGYNGLIDAIIEKFKRDNNLDLKPSQIMASNGAKQVIANVILVLVDEGDEVLMPAPYWVTYAELVNLANGKNVFIETSSEKGFKVTADDIEKAITPKTKLFIYSSPSNPTGVAYTRQELKDIAEVLAKYPDIYIISDEIYEHMNFDFKHESISQFDFLRDRTIIVNGISKAFAMTGWRLGYMAAPEWIVKACSKLQGQYTSNPCSITQKATVAALTHGYEAIEAMKNTLRRRRDHTMKKLDELNIPYVRPNGTFYIFPDFSEFIGKSFNGKTINNSKDLSLYLLEKAHVATIAGSAFGAEKCLRISYIVDESRLDEAFERIRLALSNLT